MNSESGWRSKMHKAGYCVRYVSPVLRAGQYITSIDEEAKRFNATSNYNKALVMSLADANKVLGYFGEEGKKYLEICEVYKPDENDTLRGNKMPAVVIDDVESLITQ
jgi:hypothetical protein